MWIGTPRTAAVVEDETVRDADGVSWSSLDALFVILGAFAIYIAGSIVVISIADAIDKRYDGVWLGFAEYLFLCLGTFVMVRWLLLSRRGARWHDLGFRRTTWSRLLQSVIGGEIAAIVGIAVIVAILDQLTSFHVKSNTKELLPAGQSHLAVGQYLVLLFLVAVMAPLTEETLFRGVLYQALCRDLGRRAPVVIAIGFAAIGSGAIFGLVHAIGGSAVVHTLPILAYFGVVLALTFQHARSISASILLHAISNAIAVTSLLGS